MNAVTRTSATASRRYVATLGWLAGGIVVLAAALNYFVDPNAYFGHNTLGFYTSTERQFKVLGLSRHPQDAVLLGNSKAALADTSLIPPPPRFFNAGVGGSLAEDILEMTKHLAAGSPLVVVALDFGQFGNEHPYGENLPAPFTWHEWLANLLSRDAVALSAKTIASAALRLAPTYRADGNFVAAGWYAHYDLNDPVARAQIVAAHNARLRGFQFSPQRMALLQPLHDALAAHGRFLVYILPAEAEEMAALKSLGLRPDYDAWRARVREVFPDVVDLTDTPYADPKNFFHLDIMHPYPNVGAQMIQEEVLPQLRK